MYKIFQVLFVKPSLKKKWFDKYFCSHWFIYTGYTGSFKTLTRTSLVVEWLRLSASTVGGMGSISGQRTNIPSATRHNQKKKKNQYFKKERNNGRLFNKHKKIIFKKTNKNQLNFIHLTLVILRLACFFPLAVRYFSRSEP